MLDGKNVVVLAPTAGGKTEASIFPVLSMLLDDEPEAVGALYIAPIKALLNNQESRLGGYTEMVGLRRFLWHGDVNQAQRKKFLDDPAQLLMTTPESLEVMLVSPKVPAPKLFRDLRFLIVDEVHAMAGTDRGAHLMSVIERLQQFTKHDIQRAGLSATVGNPHEIQTWLQGSSKREGAVIDPPKPPQRRELLIHLEPSIRNLASHAASKAKGHKSLFFCESRALSEAIADHMHDRGTEVFVHHSSVSLEERQLAEEQFHKGTNTAIVCTSTMELGIDVGDLDFVFQTNAPATVSSFLQRMGRTGRRADSTPNTTFFCDDPESVLQATALIELAREGWVESVADQTRCWPALVHQIFALTLQFGGIGRRDVWEQLSLVPDLRGISDDEFHQVVDHMLDTDFLIETSGLLSLGHKAERAYGKKNFMELYAVFSSPQYYRVFTQGGKEIGSLEQSFIDRLVEEMSSFLLGGRAWLVKDISHSQRTVTVEPAPRGRKPSWGGFVPKLLSFEVSQRIKKLLMTSNAYAFLSDEAADALQGYREDFSELLNRARHAIQLEDDAARWWTYAGGQINHTLKYALADITGWNVVADNFHLRIEGDGVGHGALEQAILRMSDREFWEDLDLWQGVIARIPPYRLSKFQRALPLRFQREMVGRYLLDTEGTCRFLLGDESAGIEGVVELMRRALAAAPLVEPEVEPEPKGPVPQPLREIRWIEDQEEVDHACALLLQEERVGLDVETTLIDRSICVIQFSTPTYNVVIDALAVRDFEPIARVLESKDVVKVIHNASFEVGCFQRINIGIENIFDTLSTSRRLRGRKIDGGHSLGVVCDRELGRKMDKSEQTSDWTRRPLTGQQLAYAALDVEVLLELQDAFGREMLF